ncbi:MAG TPA: hypothetical protein VFH01_05480, partial [Pyrinomonadaceae bacterium]|nr:hypothetical protein [Pyrinomonadaceae bacterium]
TLGRRAIYRDANPERVVSRYPKTVATPSELRQNKGASYPQRFQSKHFHPTRAARVGTPAWAGISERFQR